MRISFDSKKRDATFRDRKIDFADAAEVFAGPVADVSDQRFAYSEPRIVTFGFLKTRMVAVAWTPTAVGSSR